MGNGVEQKLEGTPSNVLDRKEEEKENPAREDWGLTPRQALFTPQRRMDGRSATLTIVRTALAEAIAGECMSVSFAFLQNIIVTRAHSRRVRKQTLGRMQANRPHTDNRRRPVTVSPGKLGTKVAKIFLQCMCYISLRVSSDVQMFDTTWKSWQRKMATP